MPLWIDGDYFTYSHQQLIDDFKREPSPFKNTVKETIAYYRNLNWPEPRYGISEKRRLELIEKIK